MLLRMKITLNVWPNKITSTTKTNGGFIQPRKVLTSNHWEIVLISSKRCLLCNDYKKQDDYNKKQDKNHSCLLTLLIHFSLLDTSSTCPHFQQWLQNPLHALRGCHLPPLPLTCLSCPDPGHHHFYLLDHSCHVWDNLPPNDLAVHKRPFCPSKLPMSIASKFELECRASKNVSMSKRTKTNLPMNEIEVNVCHDVFKSTLKSGSQNARNQKKFLALSTDSIWHCSMARDNSYTFTGPR